MNKILKYISVVRNNWKKSTFACVLLGYGARYGQQQLEIQNMMREFCEEAALLGDSATDSLSESSQIAVILNPAANRRSAKKNFEKYCAPLLHLSGAYVTVVETTHEGHARKITDQLDPKTTAILVAGGDGTLSETVTGLMRGRSETVNVPVGVLPLGRYNTLASHLFGSSPSEVETMASATMAVLRGRTKKLNMYRVETLDGEGEKAIYGVGWIEWGTWPWVKKRVKELWYFGGLKNYIALIWPDESVFKPTVAGSLAYTSPCSGCSRCYYQRPDLMKAAETPLASHAGGRWWSAFVKKPQPTHSVIDFKNIDNETCDSVERKSVMTTGLRLTTDVIHQGTCSTTSASSTNSTSSVSSSVSHTQSAPSLVVSIGDRNRYQGQFLFEGLKYLDGRPTNCTDLFEAKQLEIRPEITTSNNLQGDSSSKVLLIDNEEFDLRPIRITIIPNSLTVFCN